MHTRKSMTYVLIGIVCLLTQWLYAIESQLTGVHESVHSHVQEITSAATMNFLQLAAEEKEHPAHNQNATMMPRRRILYSSTACASQDMSQDACSEIVTTEAVALTRIPSPSPTLSFQALTDSMTIIPPDTNGSVGLHHVMTMLNDRVMIQSKTGAIISIVSLTGFWNATGAFDPQLTYDPYNDRWIASCGVDAEQPSSSGVLLAVSQTGDPTGNWYRFRIKGDTASLVSVDYPRLGFNANWIVVQANMYSSSGFNSSRLFIITKSEIYSGIVKSVRVLNLSGMGGTQNPARTYDPTLQTLYLLQDWNGSYQGNGYLRLYALNGPIGSETIQTVGYPSAHQTWAQYATFVNKGFAPQFNSTTRIDTGDARMLSVVFRNGSVWGTHIGYLPYNGPSHTGILWWQINAATATTQQFGKIEDTSATFNSGTFYAYPSISVSRYNNVLLGYSQFSPFTYASAAYSFRYDTDALNTMRSSILFAPGLDVYDKDFGTGDVRWGDYSSTTIDPSDDRYLWTLQEYANTRSNGQSRWATWWSKVG